MTDAGLPPPLARERPGATRDDILGHLRKAVSAISPQTKDSGSGGEEGPLSQVAEHLLAGLRLALAWDKPDVFVDSVAWAKATLMQHGASASALAVLLEHIAEAASLDCSDDVDRQAAIVVAAALQALSALPDVQPAFMQPDAPISPLAILYFRALLRGDRQLASRLVLRAVDLGTSVKAVYLHVFLPAQHEIGRLWQLNQISVAEEHYTTAATQLIMSQLYPHVFSSKKIGRTVVVVCVSGDLHELGARMVADFFEMDGWDSYYTGATTPLSGVVQAVVDRRADVLAISATIAQHVPEVTRLIGLVRSAPGCGSVRILVGGLPFNRNPDLWRQVGADGSGQDAETAVCVGNGLVDDARGRDG